MSELIKVKEYLNREISYLERRLDNAKNFGWQDKIAVITPDLLMLKAACRIIENMVVGREFMERWVKEFSGFIEGYDAEILLEEMLTELGHEVKEKGK